jgi:alkylhydroperoxidase family enzyme
VLGDEITQTVLADPDKAPISPQLKAALGLVRKLTLSPEEVGADDLRATLDAGVSEDGVVDVVYVCFAFNLIDRVADALGFDLLDQEGYRQGAQVLLRFGYKLPAPLRLLARNPAW